MVRQLSSACPHHHSNFEWILGPYQFFERCKVNPHSNLVIPTRYTWEPGASCPLPFQRFGSEQAHIGYNTGTFIDHFASSGSFVDLTTLEQPWLCTGVCPQCLLLMTTFVTEHHKLNNFIHYCVRPMFSRPNVRPTLTIFVVALRHACNSCTLWPLFACLCRFQHKLHSRRQLPSWRIDFQWWAHDGHYSTKWPMVGHSQPQLSEHYSHSSHWADHCVMNTVNRATQSNCSTCPDWAFLALHRQCYHLPAKQCAAIDHTVVHVVFVAPRSTV